MPPGNAHAASAPSTRAFHLALVALTLVAAGLRLFLLDGQSLWYDEGVTAEITQRTLANLTRWTYADIQPPLYYYVVALWGRLAGWSEWSLRFPSVFFGVLLPPLLAALTCRVAHRRSAGIIAALLAAAHPLLVYYSQEARMYSMLTVLAVALAYYVLSRRGNRLPAPGYWAGYVLLATAAAYTHYFAFFYIAALGIVFLLDLLFFRPLPSPIPSTPEAAPPEHATAPAPSVRGRIGAFVLANLTVLLLFAPWLSALFGQLSTDASYWEGEFKLDEAMRHVANRFTSGETMPEAHATLLLWGFGGVTGVAILVLLFGGYQRRRALLIGLLWLLLPVAGILGLALLVPKFNARYAMIALPGLLLLWSASLAQIFPAPHTARRTLFSVVRLVTGTLLTLFLVGVFTLANYNWYSDPAYTKAEWRELSAFIRARVEAKHAEAKDAPAKDATDQLWGATDQVVLVSGHAWPVWNYYAPDLPPLRLPDLEILDVNAILDFATTAHPLRQQLQGKDDVWLVQWQEDIVDPMQIVPLQLEIAGTERPVRNEFWHIGLAHYTDIQANAVLVEPTGISPVSANFAHQIYLLDSTVAENGDLLLFWQLHPAAEAPPADLRITAQLSTEQGLLYHRMEDRRPAGFEYPVFRWQQDQITLGRIPAAAWAGPGALPGTYRLRVGVYDIDGDLSGLDILGESGQPLGKHAIMDIQLPVPTIGPRAAATDDARVAFAELAPDLWLEVAIDTEQAEPGQAIPTELHWYADAPPPADFDLHLRWRVRESDAILGEQTVAITPLPGPEWPTGEMLRSLQQWRPPLNLPPDDYWLEIGTTLDAGAYIRVPMRILGSTRRYTAPAYTTAIERTFAQQLHLLGVIELLDFTPRAGGQVALTLVWRAAGAITDDYTVSVQWLGADNRPATQADLSLPGGSSNWLSGQVELQSVFVDVPTTPGTYRLVAAVYNPNAPDLPRLLTQKGEDLVQLAELTVIE
ncbi:MAG: glycosyltransferase family 39 protein [Litorilinea sp.]